MAQRGCRPCSVEMEQAREGIKEGYLGALGKEVGNLSELCGGKESE